MNKFIEEYEQLDSDYLLSRRALGRDALSTEAHEAIEQILSRRGVDFPPIPSAPIVLDTYSPSPPRPRWMSIAGGVALLFIAFVFIEFFKRTWVGIAIGVAALVWMLIAAFWRATLTAEERSAIEDKKAIEEGNLTDLMLAAGAGDVARMKELLEYGVDVNERSRSGSTALMFAARNNKVEAVQLLLNAGADATIKTDRGNTAISFAKKAGNRQIVGILEGGAK